MSGSRAAPRRKAGDRAVPKAAYGWQHQQTRQRLLPDAYGTLCPLCDEPMLRGQELELDHSTKLMNDPSSKGDRIVHARCNERDGAIAKQENTKFAPSREW